MLAPRRDRRSPRFRIPRAVAATPSATPAMEVEMAYLVLVRHGESEWNTLGLWTGWRDVSLTEKGHAEARRAAEALRDIQFDLGYTSKLVRAQQTLDDIRDVLNLADL